jgi:hypothetical protein
MQKIWTLDDIVPKNEVDGNVEKDKKDMSPSHMPVYHRREALMSPQLDALGISVQDVVERMIFGSRHSSVKCRVLFWTEPLAKTDDCAKGFVSNFGSTVELDDAFADIIASVKYTGTLERLILLAIVVSGCKDLANALASSPICLRSLSFSIDGTILSAIVVKTGARFGYDLQIVIEKRPENRAEKRIQDTARSSNLRNHLFFTIIVCTIIYLLANLF